MIIYLITRFIGWLWGIPEPISDWAVAPLLQMFSWVETAAEVFALLLVALTLVERRL